MCFYLNLNKACVLSFFFSEALPFFLLLIDLSRASALAKFALSSNSQVSYFSIFIAEVYKDYFRNLRV